MKKSNNKEIFMSENFSVPQNIGEEDFLTYIKISFDTFQSNIEKFDGRLKKALSKNESQIKTLYKSIIESIEFYLNGNIIKAYSTFENGLNQIKDQLLISKNPKIKEATDDFEEFYRARIGNGLNYKREDMFHIPFEKRYLVKSQRYSVNGLPCLYLSNSSYLCWEELGRPEFDKLHFSRFDLSNGNFKFLNLNHTNKAIAIAGFDSDGDMNKYSDFFVIRYLSTWPLQLATSIIVNNKDAAFKPEYIIPQLLLQWVKNSPEIDGIRYFSTRAIGTSPILFFGNLANIVIPIKRTKTNGLCNELTERILLTNPVTYEYAALLNPQLALNKVNTDDPKLTISLKPYTLNLLGDTGLYYVNTKFGQIERLLQETKAEKVVN